ncbi:MAG: hypothetical protein A3I66_23025 [Burkholderiales bacterium RIFCSPLOWO2_02_FULL_57_36]|nr:MAG: hypothetical protein A3I66_23025 [Burkholderiales bacterium RIFCSPLOWO2_02_FULL_57_36]
MHDHGQFQAHKMKRIFLFTTLFLSFFVAQGTFAAEPEFPPPPERVSADATNRQNFSIHVSNGDWNGADPKEIETLLNAIAAEMLSHFPERQLAPIEVFPTEHRPVVLYQKGPANQYQVYLAAKGSHWGEYIYEFSHELFHILANYEYHALHGGAQHQWFEEMMCEAASLYNLKRMSLAWKTSDLRTAWASYAPTLDKFTQRALNELHRQLPENTSLTQWFHENESALLSNPYMRVKNEMVAMLFLPLLEQNRDWSAVGFLNPPINQRAMRFYDYLAGWYRNTPAANRNFVVQAMTLFEFQIPVTPTHASLTPQHQTETAAPFNAILDADTSAREAGVAGSTRR